jgi:hypothetical protein
MFVRNYRAGDCLGVCSIVLTVIPLSFIFIPTAVPPERFDWMGWLCGHGLGSGSHGFKMVVLCTSWACVSYRPAVI